MWQGVSRVRAQSGSQELAVGYQNYRLSTTAVGTLHILRDHIAWSGAGRCFDSLGDSEFRGCGKLHLDHDAIDNLLIADSAFRTEVRGCWKEYGRVPLLNSRQLILGLSLSTKRAARCTMAFQIRPCKLRLVLNSQLVYHETG